MKDILELVKTKNKSVDLINVLDEMLKLTYSKKFDKELLKELPLEFSEDEDLSMQLKKAKEELLSAKVMDLTLYFEPDEAFIKKLYEWFKNNGFENFLLNINIDTKICGGLEISYNGKYVDLSIKKKVAEYVTK